MPATAMVHAKPPKWGTYEPRHETECARVAAGAIDGLPRWRTAAGGNGVGRRSPGKLHPLPDAGRRAQRSVREDADLAGRSARDSDGAPFGQSAESLPGKGQVRSSTRLRTRSAETGHVAVDQAGLRAASGI